MNNETYMEIFDAIVENPIHVFDEIDSLFDLFNILNIAGLNPLEDLN